MGPYVAQARGGARTEGLSSEKTRELHQELLLRMLADRTATSSTLRQEHDVLNGRASACERFRDRRCHAEGGRSRRGMDREFAEPFIRWRGRGTGVTPARGRRAVQGGAEVDARQVRVRASDAARRNEDRGETERGVGAVWKDILSVRGRQPSGGGRSAKPGSDALNRTGQSTRMEITGLLSCWIGTPQENGSC